MNIDERLEAVTHTLELVASMQTASEKRMAELAERTAKLEELGTELQESGTKLHESEAKLQQSMATLAEVMAQLPRVVIDHDESIEGLEHRKQ